RTDLLWDSNRAKSDLYDSVCSQRAPSDNLHVHADVLECDPATVRQCALDHAADHRKLLGDWRRLESSGVGSCFHLDCDVDLLPVCQSRRTAATGGRSRRDRRRVTTRPLTMVSLFSRLEAVSPLRFLK